VQGCDDNGKEVASHAPHACVNDKSSLVQFHLCDIKLGYVMDNDTARYKRIPFWGLEHRLYQALAVELQKWHPIVDQTVTRLCKGCVKP
jgi:hypothetical protein